MTDENLAARIEELEQQAADAHGFAKQAMDYAGDAMDRAEDLEDEVHELREENERADAATPEDWAIDEMVRRDPGGEGA